VARLQERVNSLSAQLQLALHNNGINNNGNNGNAATAGGGRHSKKRRHIPLSPHAMNVREVVHDDNDNSDARRHRFRQDRQHGLSKVQLPTTISAQRERLGRNASIATRQVLDHLEHSHEQQVAASRPVPAPLQRILDLFQRPSYHMEYSQSEQFAKDLYKITVRVRQLLEREPRCLFLQSPCYVLGDIHGNLEDLHFFSDNLWRLGLSLTAGNFLFLGDYVDRGLQCLECVAYLFCLKLQNPHKIFLLRGNHETRDVNGWEEHYGPRSFIHQCRARFGDDIGYRLWEVINQAFDRLPLAAVIDQDIFCVHGGIPRPISMMNSISLPLTAATVSATANDATTSTTTRIQDILTVPKVAGINPPYEHEDEMYQQVASDCIWSDPASEEQEMTTVDPVSGYGESLRGGGAICFGHKAVTQFLEQQDYSYIMRAHEAHAEGVAISKGARVFTVFSTSKDHNQGQNAMAGCILVDNEKLQVINRSPAYKNQYVHRRDSVSLANLSEPEIQKRIQLGLVTTDGTEETDNDDDGVAQEDEELVDEEEWQDLGSSSSEEEARPPQPTDSSDGGVDLESGQAAKPMETTTTTTHRDSGEYVLDQNRRSSVDLSSMIGNLHDAGQEEDAAMNHHHHHHNAETSSSTLGLTAGWASSTPAANPFLPSGGGALNTAVAPPMSVALRRGSSKSLVTSFAPIAEESGVHSPTSGNTNKVNRADDEDEDEEIDTVDGSGGEMSSDGGDVMETTPHG